MDWDKLNKFEKLTFIREDSEHIFKPNYDINTEKGEKSFAGTLSSNYVNFGLFEYFIKNDIDNMKLYFYKGGCIDIFLTKKYDSRILDWGIGRLAYALVSDSNRLIEEFANLKYSCYDTNVNNGTSTFMYILQCLIKDDWAEYERVLPIFKNKFLKKNKSMEIDGVFYEALACRDKIKMEAALKELVSPKMHKKRNTMPLVNEFISHPAVGYAKLAWYKGIEVEIDSPLVPKDWLPIQPLKDEEYVDYDFVKAYLG